MWYWVPRVSVLRDSVFGSPVPSFLETFVVQPHLTADRHCWRCDVVKVFKAKENCCTSMYGMGHDVGISWGLFFVIFRWENSGEL